MSGGTIEIFLEPYLPAPKLLIVGDTPIANALYALTSQHDFGFHPERTSPDTITDLTDTTAVIVASHGAGEEQTLEAALAADVPYVALVASQKRSKTVKKTLNAPKKAIARIKAPAGLDVGAKTPTTIALSILAEIIAENPKRRNQELYVLPSSADRGTLASDDLNMESEDNLEPEGNLEQETSIDEICGMTVPAGPPSHGLELDGSLSWYCSPGCVKQAKQRAKQALKEA
jgi:xanthine dehydrogenase accessory factor